MLGNFERYEPIAAFYDWLDLPSSTAGTDVSGPYCFRIYPAACWMLVSALAGIFHFTHRF
jgi:hypothetical protein